MQIPTLRSCTVLASLLLLGSSPICSAVQAAAPVQKIDFNRDIKPILANNCYHCHGPDENERQGSGEGLRLDTREGALADLDGSRAIVPEHPEDSQLLGARAVVGSR